MYVLIYQKETDGDINTKVGTISDLKEFVEENNLSSQDCLLVVGEVLKGFDNKNWPRCWHKGV